MSRSWIDRLRARARRVREDGDDRGFTLMEMVVGMTMMTVFLGIFTSSIISMFDSTNKAQSVNNTSAQLNIAFGNLDRTIRYASYIGDPALVGGNWYVAYETTNTGTPVCTQLKINSTSQQLQQRTWTVTKTGASGLTAWKQLASSITNGGVPTTSADRPFTRPPLDPSVMTSAQLNVHLLSTDGSRNSATTSLSNVTFVAVNTNLQTPTSGLCGEVSTP